LALRDPIAVYDAATNVEAQLIKLALNEAGVEAFAAEDVSTAGIWMFGTLPGINKPQVWISSEDRDRALAVLQEYERGNAERYRAAGQRKRHLGPEIEVLCEDCGRTAKFPSSQHGSIQDCPHCGAYVDVVAIGEDPHTSSDD
jgi:hypothetical protein